MVSEKYCRDCGEARPVGEFTRDRSRPDGLSFYCKVHARRRLLRSKDARQGYPGRVTSGPSRCLMGTSGVPTAGWSSRYRISSGTPVSLPVELRDRKSTRLNSSHANISYAVFCLKKKKKKK